MTDLFDFGGLASVGAVVLVALTFFFLLIAVAKRYKKVGPNEVMIISGRKHEMRNPDGSVEQTGFRIRKGGGVVAYYWLRWPLLGSLALAVGSGFVVAAAAYAILDFVFRETQAGSEFAVAETVGRDAEVITSIPPGGLGEIAYIMRGQREHSSARSIDGDAIPRGSAVVIDRVSGPTAYVRRKQ